MTGRSTLTVDEVRARVAAAPDPELPMVTIDGLGILRDVRVEDGVVRVTITPTYSGCPAVETIRDDIVAALAPLPVEVEVVLAPAWTTDDLSAEARAALRAHGIAPPDPVRSPAGGPVALDVGLRCPQCGSVRTRLSSRFGSTACKSLRVCEDCREPFDHFRPHG